MKLKSTLAAAALVAGLGFATASNAAVIAYNDVFSGGVNGTLVTSQISWQHNINDSLNVANDTILTATLSIVLLDPQQGNEQVQINLDLSGFVTLVTNVPNSGNATTYDTNLTNLQITTMLQSDGLLDVVLRVVQQGSDSNPNVTFQSSTLSGTADTNTRQVPEPATLALLGMGLLGLGAIRRRKA